MRRVIFSIVCVFLFMNLCAQREMSLEDFRRLAIENNKNLKIADEEIRASREQKKEAFTKYLPGIDAMGTYMRNQKEINLLAEDAHLPVGTIENGKFTFRPDQLMSCLLYTYPSPRD